MPKPTGHKASTEQLRLMWRMAGMAFALSAEAAAGTNASLRQMIVSQQKFLLEDYQKAVKSIKQAK